MDALHHRPPEHVCMSLQELRDSPIKPFGFRNPEDQYPWAALPAWRRSDIIPIPYNGHHRCNQQNLTTILIRIPSSSGVNPACIAHYNDPNRFAFEHSRRAPEWGALSIHGVSNIERSASCDIDQDRNPRKLCSRFTCDWDAGRAGHDDHSTIARISPKYLVLPIDGRCLSRPMGDGV